MLPMSKTYHVGMYTSEINSPSGALRLHGGSGQMTLTPGGLLNGSLNAFETDVVNGTVASPNDPFDGLYSVRGSGICMLDLDPLNPGTEMAPLWITPDGSVLHGVSSMVDDDVANVIAIEVGSGLSNATLSGDYRIVGQNVELDAASGSTFRVEQELGTATFGGSGTGTVSGSKITYTSSGTVTSPLTGSFTYSVANDGALTSGSQTGGCTADGELFFLSKTNSTGDVGLLFGVRIGSSYDLNDLAGRHSFTGHRYELSGSSAVLPRTTTTFGELSVDAASAASGSWSFSGATVESSSSGQVAASSMSSGSLTLGGAGLASNELTMTEPGGTLSLWSSPTGRFFVGREPGPHPHQLFGSRQCPASVPVGAGTSGTGGEVPRLGMRTYPQLGNGSFAFAVEGGVGGSICALPIATASSPGLPAFGGTIFIDPTAIGVTVTVFLGGTPGVAGEGAGLAPLAIPNNLSLIGFELWAQALVFDSGATADVALSNAYRAIVSG